MSHETRMVRDPAERYGLQALTQEHRARLLELAVQTAAAALSFPRVTDKRIAPCHPAQHSAPHFSTIRKRTDDVQ
ncbi:hypothetical protein [Roseomonas marmotae]|uniref:Uncharacterized protein n=1 Tax=Roseomonas marmotae TaxID=2768161 RepID=A0ABS3KAX4_9PROT|nr:hypothetical protein [Roseomonas marmotae]MBO1074623.1 hypothetical protein [Roseomonas marmotae]QTI81646.1 hypothetical protein IAI58_20185 [Roseomonas marmotae]